MKKIGIVTIDGDNNYGNRLQNYALEQSIITMGFEVETLVFPKRETIRNRVGELKRSLNRDYRIQKTKFERMSELKLEAFKPFRDNYLNNVSYDHNADFAKFDRFIAGSDQIWNPSWRLIDDYWLRFAPENKRFSYAASMATTVVHKANAEKLPRYLKEMNELSVRESESVPFVKQISGREAKLVVDPTMLLLKKDYEKLVNEQHESHVDKSRPYILVYALEGLSKELESQVVKLSSEKNWEIVTIMGNKYNVEHKVYNPVEFVEAIQNASLVVSDSFHCGVFSIIMESPFILFNRTDGVQMSSRITTLLSRFNLMQNFYDGGEINSLLEIDYDSIDKALKVARAEGLGFLSFILNKSI